MAAPHLRYAPLLIILGAWAPTTDAQVPYPGLTDHPAEVPNFLPEPFTGMVTDSDGRLFAVNPYGNSVVAVLGSTGAPRMDFDTGLNPVSLAIIEDRPDPGDKKLLVVCAGTHGLFVHDAVTGLLESYRELESEPADIVYDDDLELAFVTCQGSNSVLQFDPLDETVPLQRYAIEVGQRPGYLYLDKPGPAPTDNRVYFAAAVTGNNTTNKLPGEVNFGTVQSLAGSGGGELDDFDVYAIDATTQSMTEAIKGCGSLLFDLERYPSQTLGHMWVLGTESINADPSLPNEPALNGKFAVNRLQRVADVQGVTLRAGDVGIDLDDYVPRVPGAQYSSAHSINQARALDFAFGLAYIASPFSDLIVETGARGLRTRELILPAGSQCYDIEPIGDKLYALCLGTMTIESFLIQPAGTGGTLQQVLALPNPIALGGDPTPPQIRRGRDVFLDGKLSSDGRLSCAACHPRAMSDQLGWQISDSPSDVKDVMVTQSLTGIADTFPHHWRGERDLLDFQGAFSGLLGAVNETSGPGRDITGSEMTDLVAFFKALQAPANPNQHVSRMVSDSQDGGPMDTGDLPPVTFDPNASAEAGAVAYVTTPVPQDGEATCADCHSVESGTNGHLFPVNQGEIPRGFSTETAHLRQLQNKGRIGKALMFDPDGDGIFDIQRVVPANGFGFGHAGEVVSLRDFIQGFEATVDPAIVADITLFVDQFDQGMAPAAHRGYWVDTATTMTEFQDLDALLVSGANAGWNDFAVVGTRLTTGGTRTPMKWWFDPGNGLFEPADNTLLSLDWNAMTTAISSGGIEGVFLGLPPAAGPRFAIDFDGDGVVNGQDTAPTVFDLPGDNGQAPAYTLEVDHSNGRMAKLHLEFNEQVTYSIDYWSDQQNGSPIGPVRTASRADFVQTDTITLTHSEPGRPLIAQSLADNPLFFAEITMTDRHGNMAGPVVLEEISGSGAPLFIPDPAFPDSVNGQAILTGARLQHVQRLEESSLSPDTSVPGQVTFTVEMEVRSNLGAPNFLPPTLGIFDDEAAFLSIAHDMTGTFEKAAIGVLPGEMTSAFESPLNLFDGAAVSPYMSSPTPPWLVTNLLSAAGDATLSFTLYGLPSGTRVRVAPMGIVSHNPNQSMIFGSPVFNTNSLFFYQALLTDVSQANATHLELIVP